MGCEEPLAGDSRFCKLRDLNTGTFGVVQLAADIKTGEKVAVAGAFWRVAAEVWAFWTTDY